MQGLFYRIRSARRNPGRRRSRHSATHWYSITEMNSPRYEIPAGKKDPRETEHLEGYGGPSRGEVFFGRIGFAVLFLIFAALCLLIIFRPFFTSNFDEILSDPGDGRFEITILEHWTKSLHGQANLASPNFFYPEKGVLGYSDTLLGLAVPYAGLRYAGVDRYLAFELGPMFLTLLGFAGMFALLHKGMAFTRFMALFGAALFTISNMYYIDIVHTHIDFVVVTPWLYLFVYRYWVLRENRPAAARGWLCAGAFLFAVIFYTTFYVGWFLIACSGVWLLFYLTIECVTEGNARPISEFVAAARSQTWNILLGGAVFLLSMVPFLLLYLPSLRRTGVRGLGETLYFMPHPLGTFDVGRNSLVWGRLSAKIQDLTPGGVHEHPTGWPLFTVGLFLGTAAYCFVSMWRSKRAEDSQPTPILHVTSAAAFTCLTLWTAGVKIGSHAPVWALLWKVVPGAAAIRVPQRINLVLNIGVVIVCMFGFEALRKKVASRGLLLNLVPVLMVCALTAEQINFMPTHIISRSVEAQKFARIPPPPKACSTFYVSNWSDRIAAMHVAQTDAMLVAQQYNIPTVNGYSSWFPNGWGLMTAPKGHLDEEAVEWALQHGIKDGLCALDMNWGTWTPVDMARFSSASYLGEPIATRLANAGFEDRDLFPWAPFQTVRAGITRTQAHSGSQSLAQSEGVGSAYQDITGLQPGQRYRISAWVAASPGATAGAQIAVFDPGANVAVFSETLHPDTTWQLLSDFVTVSPPGTLRIHLFRTEGTGTIYWDDVRIFRDTSGDSKQTEN